VMPVPPAALAYKKQKEAQMASAIQNSSQQIAQAD